MGSFFKTFWAAFLAFIAANIALSILSLIFFFIVIAAIGASSRSSSKVHVGEGSILRIGMDMVITDSPAADSPFGRFDFMSMKSTRSQSIREVLTAIDAAAADSRIEGIYLDFDAVGGSMNNALLVDVHDAILKFRESSGKWVMGYGSTYSQGGYYLASTADSIFMNPQGGMHWIGLGAQVMFYKGLMDKLGIEPIILRHGTFKAAVEPFMLDRMSPENREQMETLVGSVWGSLLADIAASRGIDSTLLQQYATDLAIYSPEKAVELGMIDRLAYIDQVEASLNARLGKEQDDKLKFISLRDYITAGESRASKHFSENEIRIIYAEGTIVDGKSGQDNIGSLSMVEKLSDARQDDDVKAVVLRINSPGGSALASEVMWREIELLKAEKPVIVSMGGMAASGGYYIAAPGDVVLANRTTLTGSIGVFGLLFNGQKALKEKLGITVDVAATNPSADLGSPFRPMTDPERAYLMHSVEDVYSTFVGHVAAGRNMSVEAVDAIGQGRVWSGKDALRIGLVDGFGTIRDAIELAADRAGVADDYRVSESTTAVDPFTALMESFASARSARMKAELGDAYEQYMEVREVFSQSGVQARMLYDVNIQ